MHEIDQLFTNNRNWSERIRGEDPAYFRRLANQQSPQYLWIGCSDSRVPANQIIGLEHIAQRIVGDLADEGGASARRGNARGGVGGTAA